MASIAASNPVLFLDFSSTTYLGTTGSRRFTRTDKHPLVCGSMVAFGTADAFAWCAFYLTSVDVEQYLIYAGADADGTAGFRLGVTSGNKLYAQIGDGTSREAITGDTSLVVDTWYFACVTFDRNGNMSLYLDAASDVTAVDISSLGTITTQAPQLGGSTGVYAAARIALAGIGAEGSLPTAAEITAMVNNGNGLTGVEIATSYPDLWDKVTHCWNLNEGTNASDAYDCKGSNDASVVAAELVTDGGFEAITYGSELLTNGGFETAGAGGADIWANWTENAGDGALANETTIVNGGSDACKITTGGSGDTYVEQDATVVAGQRYRLRVDSYAANSEAGSYQIYDNDNTADIVAETALANTAASWAEQDIEFEAPSGCTSVKIYLHNAATDTNVVYFDDISLKQMTFTSWTTDPGTGGIVRPEADDTYAGDYSASVYTDAGNNSAIHQDGIFTVGNEYEITGYIKYEGAAYPTCYIGHSNGDGTFGTQDATASWEALSGITGTATGTNLYFTCSTASDRTMLLDNITVKSTGPAPAAGPREATLADTEGGYHGVLTNMDTINAWSSDVPSVFGDAEYSLEFDGTDDYVKIATNPLANKQKCTVTAWVKKTAYVQFQSPINCWGSIVSENAFLLGYESPENTLTFYVGDGTNVDSASKTGMTADAWILIAGTFDGSTGEIIAYVDGEPGTAVSSAVTKVATTNGHNSYRGIGRYSSYEWNGFIKDVRCYDVVLTPADILALKNGSDPSATPVAHWTCNDGPQGGEPNDGDPVPTAECRVTRDLYNQATYGYRPTYDADGLNGKPGLLFSLADSQHLINEAKQLAGSVGCILWVGERAATGADEVVCSLNDEDSNTRYLRAGFNSTDAHELQQRENDTADSLTSADGGGTDLAVHVLRTNAAGDGYICELNGVDQELTANSGTNGGDWADAVSADNTVIGAQKDSDGVAAPYGGLLGVLIVWDEIPTQLSDYVNRLMTYYGISA